MTGVIYVLLLVVLCLGFPALRLRTAVGWSLAGIGIVATVAALVLLMVSDGGSSRLDRVHPGSEAWDEPTKDLATRAQHSPAEAILDVWAEARRAKQRMWLLAAVGGLCAGLGFVALGWLADRCVHQDRVITELEARVASLSRASGTEPTNER